MRRLLPLALILLLIATFRLIGSAFPETLPNMQPLASLFFCGALLAKDWRGWAIPLAAWLLTYPAPALFEGNADHISAGVMGTTALAFAATFFIGKSLSGKHASVLLAGSVAAALVFHVITNGAAWVGSPLYPKTPLGLWQSLWAGPSGSSIPSWVFLRNMTAANLLFTAIFLSARFAIPRLSVKPQPAAVR